MLLSTHTVGAANKAAGQTCRELIRQDDGHTDRGKLTCELHVERQKEHDVV